MTQLLSAARQRDSLTVDKELDVGVLVLLHDRNGAQETTFYEPMRRPALRGHPTVASAINNKPLGSGTATTEERACDEPLRPRPN